MKKYFSFLFLLTLIALFVNVTNSYSQKGKGHGQCCAKGSDATCKFVDANGDGKCDNFVDANEDGKCDNCKGNGQCTGTGNCKGKGNGNCNAAGTGKGNCCNFVDADNDGKCDKFVDADNDGKCDLRGSKGKGCAKGMGHGNKNCKFGTNKSNTQSKFTINQNAPNPVSNFTKLSFNLKETNSVKVELYDSYGKKVKEVFEGKLPAGDNTVDLNTTEVTPGNYFYTVEVAGKVQSKQLIILK
ncbi:MAG: Por secretion system C-terminal sorting protein [Ignavibacteria bacterium]|nr:Por secretion system C-terminal sorting protein [Ignavibacteria bacterium]